MLSNILQAVRPQFKGTIVVLKVESSIDTVHSLLCALCLVVLLINVVRGVKTCCFALVGEIKLLKVNVD